MHKEIENLIRQSCSALKSVGIDASAYEIRLMLAAALNCEPEQVISFPRSLSEEELKNFSKFLDLRIQRKPVDKIIGRRGFYKYDFAVNEDVLSPRPDTEILTEAAINEVKKQGFTSALELGVGSGCIILSMLADCPNLRGLGIDISTKALEVAKINAQNLNVANRLELRQGDWFATDFMQNFDTEFDIIVSNPPYINTEEIALLEPEVRKYDPISALDGGKDGLASYRRIAEIAPKLLKQGGMIYLEVGETQADDVAKLFIASGLQLVAILEDLAGIKRCVTLKK